MEMGEIVIQNINQVYHNENLGDFNALSDINLRLRKEYTCKAADWA